MEHHSPSIQQISQSRRCAVHIGFNTADIVYSICDHLSLGEAAVLAFVSSSLMDLLRGNLAKLNAPDNLEHSRYAMQRLRFFDHKMPGKYWCMPCDQYHPWDKRLGVYLNSDLLFCERRHPDPARDIRVHLSATIAASHIQLLKRARCYETHEYGIEPSPIPYHRHLGYWICGEAHRSSHHDVTGSWRGGHGMILCIESEVDIAVEKSKHSMTSAESWCAAALARLTCMCECKPRCWLYNYCDVSLAGELPKARVIQCLADFLCNCHSTELANDIYKDCMDAVQSLHRYRRKWKRWDVRNLPVWDYWNWRRCSPGCNMLVRVGIDKIFGKLSLIRYHDLGPDSTFNGGPAQNVSSLYRVTSTGTCKYRGWHNEHDRFQGRNWKDILIPVLSKLGGIGWVDRSTVLAWGGCRTGSAQTSDL